MPARKDNPRGPSSVGARAFAVAVESLRSDFTVFGEALGALRDQTRLGFERLGADVDLLKADMVSVKADIASIKVDLGLVKTAVLETSRELKEVRVALDRKVDRDELEGAVVSIMARAST